MKAMHEALHGSLNASLLVSSADEAQKTSELNMRAAEEYSRMEELLDAAESTAAAEEIALDLLETLARALDAMQQVRRSNLTIAPSLAVVFFSLPRVSTACCAVRARERGKQNYTNIPFRFPANPKPSTIRQHNPCRVDARARARGRESRTLAQFVGQIARQYAPTPTG